MVIENFRKLEINNMNIWYITLLWHERVEFDKKTNKTRYLLCKNTNDKLYILLGGEASETEERKIFQVIEPTDEDIGYDWFEGSTLLSYGDIDWDWNIFPEKNYENFWEEELILLKNQIITQNILLKTPYTYKQ